LFRPHNDRLAAERSKGGIQVGKERGVLGPWMGLEAPRPAGTHALVLWNETIEPATRQVTVPDGGEVEVNFAVAASPAPK